jgi:hypothetical protein
MNKHLACYLASVAVLAAAPALSTEIEQMKPTAPVFMPHGPFMIAVDPDQVVVRQKKSDRLDQAEADPEKPAAVADPEKPAATVARRHHFQPIVTINACYREIATKPVVIELPELLVSPTPLAEVPLPRPRPEEAPKAPVAELKQE